MKRNLLFSLLISFNSVLFAQNPIADFSYTDVCLGTSSTFNDLTSNSPTTWDWAFGDGGVSTQQNPTYTYSSPGNYTVTLIAYNGIGYDTTYKIVSVFALPIVDAGVDATICEGSSVTLNGSGAITYNWSPATGLSSTTVSAPNAFPTSTTTYTLTGTDANGCVASDFVNVTVNPLPNINAGSDQTICFGGSFTPMASGGISYSWDNGAFDGTPTYPSVTTTYTVVGTDANGCTASDSVTITVNDQIILTDVVSHVSCFGGSNGTITISPSGGSSPYTFSWTPIGATTDVVTNLTAGTYSVTVTDMLGCTEVLNSEVTEPGPIFINFTTVSDVTCFGANDGYININVNGGTIGYSYIWSNTETSLNISNLIGGTYSVLVTDANNCTSIDSTVVNEPLPDGKISGVINYQSSPINSGSVELIRKNGVNPNDMTIVDTYTLSTGGNYMFENVEAGIYIVKAYGDTSLYNCAPTYSINESQWNLATEWDITSNCSNDSLIVSIDLIELPNLSGLGTINGRLIESGGPLFKAPGEPIPDIDITVDQSPGGNIMAATTTDIDGYFSFTDLPMGTYIIRADMFGYGMDTLQTITFNGTNNSYNVTLCSNDTINMVDMCNMTITGVNEVVTNSLFNIYPNPAKDFLNVSNNNVGNIKIDITDLTGKIIFTETLQNNFETIDISSFKKGIYIITLSNTNIKYIQKLVIN